MSYLFIIILIVSTVLNPLVIVAFIAFLIIFLIIFYFVALHLRQPRFAENTKSFWPRVVLKTILDLQGVKLEVAGRENIPATENYVVVANHQSNYDILALIVAFSNEPIGFVAKKSLEIPWLKQWMYTIGCVFIDRSDARQTMNVLLKEVVPKVKSGKPMVLFPEGTRSKSPKMNEFNAGGLVIAKSPKAMILPVSISGTYKIARNFSFKRTVVKITIHQPMAFDDYNSKKSYAVVATDLQTVIRNSVDGN